MHKHRTRSRRSIAVALAMTLLGALFTTMTSSTSAQAEVSAGESLMVSGQVVDPSGNAVAWADVEVWRLDYDSGEYWQWDWTSTDESGIFGLDLIDGAYTFRFSGYGWSSEWYDDQPEQSAADAVQVAGVPIVLNQVVLDPWATVSGRVVDKAGGGIPDVEVSLETYDGEWLDGTMTGEDGSFAFDYGVQQGDYVLRFRDDASTYLEQWLNLSVPRTGEVVVPDVVLTTGATIEGTVRDEAGLPIKRIAVGAVAVDGDPDNPSATATTDLAGHYRVTGLAPGEYKLQFYDWFYGYDTEWYRDTSSFESALVLTVAGEETITGVDAVLSDSPQVVPDGVDLTGTVAGRDGAPVIAGGIAAYDAESGEEVELAGTNRAGRFYLTNLSTGSYKLHVYENDTAEDEQPYLDEWYTDELVFDSATPVSVTADADQEISVVLDQAATVSGRLTDDTGQPMAEAQVLIRDVDGVVVDSAYVERDGSYRHRGLRPGTYRLEYQGWDENYDSYVREWWREKYSFATATPLNLGSGQVRSGLDATLTKTLTAISAPRVSGRPDVGATLTADPGTWTLMAQARYAYAWLRGTKAVGTGPTYRLGLADAGQRISVRVDARVWEKTGTAVSAQTAVVKSPSATTLTGTSPRKGVARLVVVVKVPGVVDPGGTLRIKDGATVVRRGVPVVDGRAVVSLGSLRAGRHSFTALYSGTAKVRASTSAKVALVVR